MNHLKILSWLAILEGISYISFGITMPLKYMLHWPLPNYIVGMLHGVLFIAYCLWVLICRVKYKKKNEFFVVGCFMSLIPFGTFWFERKYLRETTKNGHDIID